MTQPTYPSTKCILCDTFHDRPTLDSHLARCVTDRTVSSKKKPMNVFHVEISGDSLATGAAYWLHVLARADATLLDLDAFLRKSWLEPCCGHLSAFTADSVRFEAYPEGDFGPPAEAMGDYPLVDVLGPGKVLAHEYDFGSTTALSLRVLGQAQNVMKGRGRIELLARNAPPVLSCGSCSSPATRVCAVGCEAPETLACSACAPDHGCGADMMSLIVNSPRTGTCGYPTEPLEEQ